MRNLKEDAKAALVVNRMINEMKKDLNEFVGRENEKTTHQEMVDAIKENFGFSVMVGGKMVEGIRF
jgi:hypothetical protein